MLTRTIKTLMIALLVNALPLFFSGTSQIAFNMGSVVSAAEFQKDPFPVKNSKHYNESNDPAFKRCGTNSEGPQHGYFAVPLLVLGLAGVLLYFTKNSSDN